MAKGLIALVALALVTPASAQLTEQVDLKKPERPVPAAGEAMIVLRARLYEMQREERDSARSAERKGQVGSGDRSERIRTYNFPQGRVTDHRINLTLYKLDKVMAGEALDELIEALITENQAAQLAAMESGI